MKLKASEIFEDDYFITPLTNGKAIFKTKKEGLSFVEQWNNIEEYKKQLDMAKEALRSVIRHGIREGEGYEDTLEKIYNVLDN